MELERIFDHMECTGLQKISCAKFQFAEDTGHLWKPHERTLSEEQKQAMTWEEFKRIAMDHYFPQSVKDQKDIEFVNLKQGTLLVMKYECEVPILII